MLNFISVLIVCAFALTGCDQQRQASADLGNVPKKIVDKATNDINKAASDAADKLKSLDDPAAPAKKE